MHYTLNKGVTYVYRIGYYNFDREGTVKYALEKGKEVINVAE